MINILLTLVLGSILPILLWPIEYILPFPHFVEEIVKLSSLLFLRLKIEFNLKLALLFAIAFTISEAILYTMNFFILGQLYLLPKRLLLTGTLHITTILILFISLNKNIFWKIGMLTIAIYLHYTYNYLMS